MIKLASLELSAQIILTIVSSVSIIMGIWHIVLPYAQKWFKYMPEAPEEVKDSIEATNFFFSLFLIMIGGFTIYLTFWQWTNIIILKVFLISMVTLLLARIAFQIVKLLKGKRSVQQYLVLGIFCILFLLYSIPTILILVLI